jgi:hypothetical protein
MQKQTLRLKRSKSQNMLRKFAALFLKKRTMKSEFRVRGAKLITWRVTEAIASVIHVHTNKWILIGVHGVYILPILSAHYF